MASRQEGARDADNIKQQGEALFWPIWDNIVRANPLTNAALAKELLITLTSLAVLLNTETGSSKPGLSGSSKMTSGFVPAATRHSVVELRRTEHGPCR